ncbi:MAG TPA: type I DNA topoisomerase [Verrucomicrobiae bacterium]|nr:type I DNA topoisomerase [Verrucomicrobiae bacterium]
MAKNLVIVESPAKAKTIEKYLGKDYSVKSSFGHIRDLPKKGMSIDIAKNFAPTYEISPEKKKVVAELKKALKGAEVWLASDEDREGEAIAWHLCEALKLDPKKTKRIVFHEITKSAIEAAIENPRTVDMNLVDAQQARRILDRLVGYELSPVLWKKVRPGLSAGRVQSVAVRLIVEREREIKDFQTQSSFKVTATFHTPEKAELPAELTDKIVDEEKAEAFLQACAGATFTVKDVATKPGTRNPGAPFTTSVLQQEAARRLGYSVKQTMTLAQRLYENGHITYMRTDSTILSGLAIKAAEDYITKEYGAQYHQVRQYKTKDKAAQEAHEAIRPTDFRKVAAGDDPQQKKLYDLIWRRALASQMAPAQIDRTEILIDVSDRTEQFLGKGEIVKFDGWFKVYGGGKEDVLLPPVQVGEKLALQAAEAHQTFSRPPARYGEAGLVRKLEELGIGRPSTYAPTISTIQTRGYVEKGDLQGEERTVVHLALLKGAVLRDEQTEVHGADRSKLTPTSAADVTTDFLVRHFASVVDYDFTATVEEDFDAIADGKRKWEDMLKEFYKDFHALVKEGENVSREETSQARVLGPDPKSSKPIIARYGRFGPMLQRGETESEEKPDFAPLPEGVDLEDVTLEQALEMFKLPRTVGTTEQGEEIKSNIGRYGPYIQIGKLFVSIKGHDPMKITEEEARELYAAKLKQEAERHIADFGKIKILNGPYGPYVTDGTKNARIPKETDATKLTETDAKKILDEAPAKKRFGKRAAKK